MSLAPNVMGYVNMTMNTDLEPMPERDGKEIRLSVNGDRIISDLSPRITITFHNICRKIDVPGKMIDPKSKEKTIQRTLLNNISKQLHSEQIVALMGPSDCGKTTLLDVLADRKLDGVCGNIWINNQLYEISMKRKFAYVLQEDIFFEELTLKQQFIYTQLYFDYQIV